eukprot:TRINITY_DN7259_c0_g1_i1.p1 TRINITY_DN7259_c0_g1~~TRINITY_DN7259_c0_g1_i1.p1  ORF type:complete len:160 (+),score=12.42 TRINITY_DN7259_c0_g1_i1:119-598(+)
MSNQNFVPPPYDKPYAPPSAEEFELDYECYSCHGAVTGQNASSIRTTKDGKVYRVCPLCSRSMHLHYPPHFVPVHKQTSKCCGSGCDCTDYRPGKDENTWMTCACGHLGSYHMSLNPVVGGTWHEATTRKAALKKTSTYGASHNDMTIEHTTPFYSTAL